MISLINVVDDIKKDFEKNEYATVSALTRSYVLAKNNRINVSVIKKDKSCELEVMIPENVSAETLSTLPKWKGMETKIVTSGSDGKKYLVFHQRILSCHFS